MTVCAWKIHGDRAWLSLRHSIFVAFWNGSVFAGSESGQPCRGDEVIAAGHHYGKTPPVDLTGVDHASNDCGPWGRFAETRLI